jgi:hypothetical protein
MQKKHRAEAGSTDDEVVVAFHGIRLDDRHQAFLCSRT